MTAGELGEENIFVYLSNNDLNLLKLYLNYITFFKVKVTRGQHDLNDFSY